MYATGEKPRLTDITGFILLVYENDQPVLLSLPYEDRVLCPVFSTKEKLVEASAWIGLQQPTRPKRITDQKEFLSSFDGFDVMVAADPYIHDGNTHCTAICLDTAHS